MRCPNCEKHLRRDWLEHECIEPNDTFDCPHCAEHLRYSVDEGTYFGAQHVTIEIVDD